MERPRQFWRPETCTQGLWGHVLPLGGKRKLRVSKLISFLKCWAPLVVRLTDSVQPFPWQIFCFLCVSVTTLANALPWPMCWFFRLKCQFPVAYFLSTCWLLLLGKKGAGEGEPEEEKRRRQKENVQQCWKSKCGICKRTFSECLSSTTCRRWDHPSLEPGCLSTRVLLM